MDDVDDFGVRWNPKPGDTPKGESYRIIRAPTSGALPLLILSHRVLRVATHWWNGRTQGCRGDQCQACIAGESARLHGYFVARNSRTQERVIVEVTEGPIDRLEMTFSQSRTLRGWTIHLTRVGDKSNGKVIVRFCEQLEVDQRALLPDAPELSALLRRVWGWETFSEQQQRKNSQRKIDPPDQHFGIVD